MLPQLGDAVSDIYIGHAIGSLVSRASDVCACSRGDFSRPTAFAVGALAHSVSEGLSNETAIDSL